MTMSTPSTANRRARQVCMGERRTTLARAALDFSSLALPRFVILYYREFNIEKKYKEKYKGW